MLNYFLTVLGIIVALKIGIGVIKFMFFRRKQKSEFFYRIKKLTINRLCLPLDIALAKQEKKKQAIINKLNASKSQKIVKLTSKQSNAK